MKDRAGPRRPAWEWLSTLLAAILVTVAAVQWGYHRFQPTVFSSPTPHVTATATDSAPSVVTATGALVLTKQMGLGFPTGGVLAEMNVGVGDAVKAGQTLARLDARAIQIQETQAEANLRIAQANLQKLMDAPPPQVAVTQTPPAGIASAQLQADQKAVGQAWASLQSAQAKLRALQTPHTQAEIAAAKAAVDQARAAVASAQAHLDAIKNPYTPADFAAAQATIDSAATSVRSAQANLAQTRAGANPADLAAQQAAVAQAQADLLAAQATLQAWQNGSGQDTNASSMSQAAQALQAAQANYDASVAKLNSMQSPSPADLQAAEAAQTAAQAEYDSAVARLNEMKAGPSQADVQRTQQAVDRAEAALSAAQSSYDLELSGPDQAALAQAQSQVDAATAALSSAQSKLARDQRADQQSTAGAPAQTSPTPGTAAPAASALASAQQQVDLAQTALDQARRNLASATITAPFDGVVAAVNASPGEKVGTSPIITLVDPSAVRVDVTVGETDMVRLALGQPATITFDALPGTSLNGKVIGISPARTSDQGEVSYLVSVGMDKPPRQLLAGMKASVSIQTQGD